MKALERIFLYTVLAILIFYVFLVDGNVESKVAIQKEIRARSIIIVNDDGQRVVRLCSDKAGHGGIIIYNKDDTVAATMMAREEGGTMGVSSKHGKSVALITVIEFGGMMRVYNKDGKSVALMAVYKDNGIIAAYNKKGDVIGHLP